MKVNTPNRLIAHFDLDRFFVAVEELKDPTLKGKPVIIGGKQRGVVSTCSYEARKFGVKSGMPSIQAERLCPQAIFISGRGSGKDYKRYSNWVTEIIASKAPLFEKASVDEFYIDLSGMEKFFNPLEWTIALRKQIMDETLLPISFGMGANKMIAKIATDEAKPNGYLFIEPGNEKSFLSNLLVEKIPGVGDHTLAVLNSMQMFKISDIQIIGSEILEERLGKYGADLWFKAQGIHNGVVKPYKEAKSISCENTFNDNIYDKKLIEKELVKQTERVAFELRADNKFTTCVAIKIRYPNFETHSKQITIPATQNEDDIIKVVKILFNKVYNNRDAIRLIGVKLSEFNTLPLQTDIFQSKEKKIKLNTAVDEIKNKFGKSFIKRGGGLP